MNLVKNLPVIENQVSKYNASAETNTDKNRTQ